MVSEKIIGKNFDIPRQFYNTKNRWGVSREIYDSEPAMPISGEGMSG